MSSRERLEHPTLPRHLYVHVPLCRSKCAYCDFYSVAPSCDVREDEIALLLLRQAEAWLDRGLAASPLRSLYIGGGTPTMLGGALPFLVDSLRRPFGVLPDAEITIEANPDSLDAALVSMLRAAGVTRVSLGVQSLHDAELRSLGRAHDAEAAREAARLIAEAGLAVSVDLMCGIPGQTERSWVDTLSEALKLPCEHVSVYPLSVEDGTPLAAAVEAGAVLLPEEDDVAAMMETAVATLAEAGLSRYEVANFARPGSESVHNTAYWTGAEYLGVGPSAHGMLVAETAVALGLTKRTAGRARVRYSVMPDLGEGLETNPPLELEYLSEAEALREDAMLGLRRAAGITEALAAAAGVTDVLQELVEQGLLVNGDGRWKMSDRGWLLGNEVFARVWAPDCE